MTNSRRRTGWGSDADQRRLVEAFVGACREGDLAGLVALLDPEVVWRADGGGKVATWPRTERGAENVARWLIAYLRQPPRGLRLAEASGGPGIVMRDAFGTLTVIAFTVDAGRIAAIDVVRNPDKLIGVPDPAGEAPPPRAGEGPPPVSSPGASPSRGVT